LKKHQISSKRLLLIAAAVVAILAVIAAPVLAANNEDRRASDALAHFLGLKDAEQLAEYLGFENEADEPCGPACSYYADNFAEAAGLGSAEAAAKKLKLGGGEDEFAQALYGSENLRQLARAVGLETADELAAELEVDRSVLADVLRDRSNLEALAELQALAEDEGFDKDEFAPLLQAYSDDLGGLAQALGFASPDELVRYLDLEDRRDLRQLLRDSNPEETNKLEELAELRQIAEELGFSSIGALADHLGVDSRRELVRLLQDADTPREVAEALGFESVGDLAEHLGVDRDELAALLDEAKSDDGVANTDSDDEEPANYDGDEESATSVSQESEQEAESGEVNQSFTITSEGDNSNQSAAVQGTANTGNAQSQTSVVQSGSEAEDIEVEGGSSIEVSPELDTQTQQAVEQAAAAAADPEEVEQAPAASK
jgi:uncharacterized protein YidB (DUF937 family)